MRYLITALLVSIFFISCKEKTATTTQKISKKSSIQYATGFDIILEGNQKKLIIKQPYQNAKQTFTYLLTNTTNITKKTIKIPLENVVVTSTTHIAMLELLHLENLLVGFPKTKFISSVKTRKRIDAGFIAELGSAQEMNTEKLIELAPKLVIAFGLNGNNKVYKTASKNGILTIYNGDWLEETPLGRAEWIKFFGVLFGKEKEADSIFKSIETRYLKVKELAAQITNTPTVLSGNLFKDVWYMPAGESFIANYFKDANTNYLWNHTTGSGSMPLSIESVLDKAQDATYWIGCGLFENKKDMLKTNSYYNAFNAFKKSNIYTYATNKGETGGLVYFEKSPTRPDLVLKDIIKITQPQLLPDYQLTFFEKME